MERWFTVPITSATGNGVSLRLFCFPHAGGSAALFHRWPLQLPKTLELLGVQLPGRGSRFNEPHVRRLGALVEGLSRAMIPLLDRPWAVFGHSFGALVGFELVRRLRRAGAPLPRLLVVSGRDAPQRPTKYPPIHHLAQDALLAELHSRYGTADEALADPELAELLYPALQADFEMFETWSYQHEEPLDVPIAAFGGDRDDTVSSEDLAAWGEQTRASFQRELLAGDHFYLVKDPQPLLARLQRLLAPIAEPPGA